MDRICRAFFVLLICEVLTSQAVAQTKAYVQINSSDAVEFIVTNPDSQSTGVDPRMATDTSTGYISELEGANYADMSVGFVPDEGEEPEEEEITREFVYTPRMPDEGGTYWVRTIGLRRDKFELHGGIDFIQYNGELSGYYYSKVGVTAPGFVSEYLWYISPDTSQMQIIKLVSPSSAREELGIMQALDWVTEEASEEIQQHLQQAENRLVHGDSAAARTLLQSLQARLDAQQAVLHEDAYAILQEDVEALLGSLPGEMLVSPAALFIEAEGIQALFDGNAFRIDGTSHDLDGAVSTYAQPKHALAASTTAGYGSVVQALTPAQAAGITGGGAAAPDVVHVEQVSDLKPLVDRMLKESEVVTLGSRMDKDIGSETEPVIAYAPDGLTLAGAVQGTGLLVVNGPLEMRGSSVWHGLIVVRDDKEKGAPQVAVGGNASVIGSLVIQSSGTPELVLQGAATVRYSRPSLDLLEDRLLLR